MATQSTKKHVYGITKKTPKNNFGPIGYFGREVTTVDRENIAAVVSDAEEEITISKENLLTHIKVLDTILMEGFDILPFKFATVAENEEEVKNLLKDGYTHWQGLLDRTAGAFELTLQIFWIDFDAKVQELVDKDNSIKDLRDRMLAQRDYRSQITAGEIFKNVLEDRKRAEAKQILDKLAPISKTYKQNQFLNDANIANFSFLVERDKEKEFDETVKKIIEEKKDQYLFKYYGPSAPFNFIQ